MYFELLIVITCQKRLLNLKKKVLTLNKKDQLQKLGLSESLSSTYSTQNTCHP